MAVVRSAWSDCSVTQRGEAFAFALCLVMSALMVTSRAAWAQEPATKPDAAADVLRVAAYNVSMYRDKQGQLADDLASEVGDEQARKVAAVIQRVRPDIILLNEFDYDPTDAAAQLFRWRYLAVGQHGEEPIHYPYRYCAPSNTGVPSGMDLNRDGEVGGPGDAYGWGEYPGRYGMLLLSRYPIDTEAVRTWRKLLWSELAGAKRPIKPDGEPWYPDAVWAKLRLSSKSHWDVPVMVGEKRVHILASHPTPPVFDGPEDRNGARNHDEIRLWIEHLNNGEVMAKLADDQGRTGGLEEGSAFVIVGDLNADPVDGDSMGSPAADLLAHPRTIAQPVPRSPGAALADLLREPADPPHQGNPAHDTADWGTNSLRADYALPGGPVDVLDARVFWPTPDRPAAAWLDVSDHRLVWVTLRLR